MLHVDFGGTVCYEAFRKIIDYIYLDDHQWLLDQAASEASSSTEMVETIKLAKQYRLESLFKACETHFKELMVQSFDCTNLITLKNGNGSSIYGSLSSKSSQRSAKQGVRSEVKVEDNSGVSGANSRAPGGRAP